MLLVLLKQPVTPDLTFLDRTSFEVDKSFDGVRCPLCHWRPDANNRWRCECNGTPEPFFHSCGTVWNTFLTGGRCPGCDHQWQWTSCLRCEQASPHQEWYGSDA